MSNERIGYKEVKKQTDDLKEMTLKILESADDVSFLRWINADIYLIGDDTYKELLYIKNSAIILNEKRAKKIAKPLFDIMKLINEDYPCIDYKLTTKEKYVYISSKENVHKRVSSSFPVWINEKRLTVTQLLEEGNYSESFISEVTEKTENEIKARSDLFNFVIENLEKFNSSYTTKKVQKIKPTIYFHTTEKTGIQEHLREQVPNILWYKPAIVDFEGRKDKKVDKVVKEGFEVFKGFFVSPKDGFKNEWNEFLKYANKIHKYSFKDF